MGGGFVVAAIVIWLWSKERTKSEETIAKLGQDFRQTVESNTAAMTKLCTLVEEWSPQCGACPLMQPHGNAPAPVPTFIRQRSGD
jgi:hypothetical protein